jgi:hypothetical protein
LRKSKKDYLGDLGINGRIILMILKKEGMIMWTGFLKLRIGTSGERVLVNMVMNLQVP